MCTEAVDPEPCEGIPVTACYGAGGVMQPRLEEHRTAEGSRAWPHTQVRPQETEQLHVHSCPRHSGMSNLYKDCLYGSLTPLIKFC